VEIYLIRHTRPAVPAGLCYGRHDVALDEADLMACVPRILEHLPRELTFYSSPASRCTRLAERLVAATGGTLAGIDARLHEMHFGDWEGHLWSDLPREQTELWTSDIVRYSPPNGENFMAMWGRVTEFYEGLLDAALRGQGAPLAIVAHAGSLKVLVMRTLNLAPRQYACTDVAQGRVTRIDVNRSDAGELYERLMFLNR